MLRQVFAEPRTTACRAYSPCRAGLPQDPVLHLRQHRLQPWQLQPGCRRSLLERQQAAEVEHLRRRWVCPIRPILRRQSMQTAEQGQRSCAPSGKSGGTAVSTFSCHEKQGTTYASGHTHQSPLVLVER